MAENTNVFLQALIYSCIAFSIVFIVLGGLTLVIYAMRILTGNAEGGNGNPPAGKKEPAVKAAPAPAAGSNPAAPVQAVGVKSHHVAAITAAILALTNGRGKILSIAPAARSGFTVTSETTRMWRAAAIMESVGRRLAPSWKR